MRITRAESPPLFAGPADRPAQVLQVTLAGLPAGPVLLRAEGAGVSTRQPLRITGGPAAEQTVEVPVTVAAPHRPGSRLPVTVIADSEHARAELAAELTVAEPGWTVWLVCHFHYDPVWWRAQGETTQTMVATPGEDGRPPEVRSAFELVRAHLDAARDDPDYKFVLAEVDYLKPYFDTHPQHRAELAALLRQGRVELAGGAYNEPNTNLTCAESTIRNIVYGLGHQRDLLGGDPRTAWALDAFGHDPGYPGLMAAAGMTASAWARGPYHQWGPWRTVGSNERMQFPSEFEWISPDGRGLLTSYLANHYGAGWGIHRAASLAEAKAEVLAQLALLAPVAATRQVLLPVGADHVIPACWAGALHRHFAARYAWPRCVIGLPREFFAAVAAEAARRRIWLTPQTRDMNPVYPGKDVSYIDTKQAQRAAEVAVLDGERLATLAWLAGAGYPAESLDKAWRLLAFGAHHDAITGTESEQVYLDLLAGWREAYGRGEAARRAAAGFLAGLIDTRSLGAAGAPPARPAAEAPAGPGAVLRADGRCLAVFNTLSFPRVDLATVRLGFGPPGPPGLTLRDEAGAAVPFLAEGAQRHPGGGLAEVTLAFRAEVPALGYRAYRVAAAPGRDLEQAGWQPAGGTAIANDAFAACADPRQGGALTTLTDRCTGAQLLRGLGNELVIQEEYAEHPRWGEGPWLLCPKGPGASSGAVPARVRAERCPIGARLVAEFSLPGEPGGVGEPSPPAALRVCQETLLWDGIARAEFRTHVDGSIGRDRLLRVRFAADAPGGLPVFAGATAVVGRPFGTAGADVAEHPFTLDNPAQEWFGLSSAARVSGAGRSWAIGVAEVIVPGWGEPPGDGWRSAVRELMAALAAAGVTATCTAAGGPRYGALDLDSNLPDCRIVLGGPGVNGWATRLLAALGSAAAKQLAAALSAPGGGRVFVPAARPRSEVFCAGADVRGERDLPVLVVAADDLAAAARALAADLADAVIEADVLAPGPVLDALTPGSVPGALAPGSVPGALAPGPAPEAEGRSVALANRGTPGSLVTPDGTLYLALMRAPGGWPTGVWRDGPRRTAPDGSSFAWQHWSHTFHYALLAGPGDWREAGFGPAGLAYNHRLLTVETGVHGGPLPARASLAAVTTVGPGQAGTGTGPAGTGTAAGRPSAVLSTLKPRGNPLARGRAGEPSRAAGVTVRLADAGSLPGGVTAQVSLPGGVVSGHASDLTEGEEGPPVTVAGGKAVISVPAGGLVTLALAPGPAAPEPAGPASHGAGPATCEGAPGTPGPGAATPGGRPPAPEAGPAAPEAGPATLEAGPATPEPVQPVFTRYWLPGKGPAPAGNLPVSVHLSPGEVTLPAHGRPGSARLRLSVTCGPEPARGEVRLDVPAGLVVTCPGGRAGAGEAARDCPLQYALAPHGYASWDLAVRAEPGAARGRYFLAAQITDRLGQRLEDAVLVMVGEAAGAGHPGGPRPAPADLVASLRPAALALAPGEAGELTVRLASRAASLLRGECQLLSPFGSWDLVRPWVRGFTVGPGQAVDLGFPVTVPARARPGASWWALAKVMYFGRACYSEPTQVTVRP
jgi:hypothetical protein